MTASAVAELERVTLGCDRLGSVNGLRGREVERLVSLALDLGIRWFDTAPVYGQGESERLLGRMLAPHRERITLITKVGQYFPASARLLFPAKAVAYRLAKLSPRASRLVLARRGGLLPQTFTPDFIEAEVERSLRRLRAERIDILLLHSPPADEIGSGRGLETLARLRNRGLAARIGVATETSDAALAALDSPLVEAVEFPIDDQSVVDRVLDRATARGALAIVRGAIRAGLPALGVADPTQREEALATLVRSVLARPGVTSMLVGTTSNEHLRELAVAVRAANAILQVHART